MPSGTMPLRLRLASHTDLPSVEDIAFRAYSPYVDRIGRMPGPMTDDYEALIDAGRVRVIESGGVIEATLVLIPEDDTMLLDNIAVAPAAQGKGLGRTLLNYAEQTAREFGFRFIRLYTNEAMSENIELYIRIGYAETHRGESDGLKRVYMVKALG
jgi:GNAT superfamily N-acetyltransferase